MAEHGIAEATATANELLGTDVTTFELLADGAHGMVIRRSRDVVVHLAVDEATRSRLTTDALRLAWAHAHGIPVPEVVAATDVVLITQRHADDGALDEAAIANLLLALDSVRVAPAPPMAQTTADDDTRRLWRRLRTVAVAARWSLRPWQLFAAQRAFTALPSDVTCHGDLSRDNLLVAANGDVVLIDLELAGVGPDGWDIARLVPTVAEPAARGQLADALASRVGVTNAATLLRWAAARQVTDLIELGATAAELAVAADRRRHVLRLIASRSVAPHGA